MDIKLLLIKWYKCGVRAEELKDLAWLWEDFK